MRSTPRAARRSAVLRPRPRLAPVTSAVLGCVSTRDVLPPPTLCRTPNGRIPTHVVTHHDATHARPTEETARPRIGDPSGGGGPYEVAFPMSETAVLHGTRRAVQVWPSTALRKGTARAAAQACPVRAPSASQAAAIAFNCSAGGSNGRYSIVVDDDFDPSNTTT